MGYPREKVSVLQGIPGSFDIGNAGTNVSVIPIPFKCEVLEAFAFSNTAAANSYSVGFNYCVNGTCQTANNIGLVTVTDAAAAYAPFYDVVAKGTVLAKHSLVMVDVEEAGDSGEKGFAGLVVAYLPETDSNDATDFTETA